mmetsp:Transcript_80715/g.216349  ORF Transcript_80715/g.216349 Transcript_80715/m.216349 type:complete len:282 (+) Transcript_80715:37-882(+)
MVLAERGRLLQTPQKGSSRVLIAAAAASVFAAVVVVSFVNRSEPVELYAKRPLTPEEKKFVSHAVSTPDRDLHRAAKLTSKMGANDMNDFYDQMSKSTVVKDKHIDEKIKKLHKKASTLSALKDINTFFDSLDQQKKVESKKNLAKEAGRGKAAAAEINSYFDSLDASEKAVNEKDILNLGTGASVAKAAKQRIASLKKAVSSSQVSKAKKIASVKAHVGENDVAARNEILDYFDQLDAKEAKVNQADEQKLSAKGVVRPETTIKLDSAASDKDLNSYFDQ